MKVRKAVIIAAGRGTRFLPMTRSLPKEMVPLVDKPLIQYSVEEAVNSGIEQIFMVTARGKQSMEDYFDGCLELEYFLEQKGEAENTPPRSGTRCSGAESAPASPQRRCRPRRRPA